MKAGTGCVDAEESEASRRVNQPTTCLRLTASLIPTTIRMALLLPIEGARLYHKGGACATVFFLPKKGGMRLASRNQSQRPHRYPSLGVLPQG